MGGRESETAGAGHGPLRASDADRERVIDGLKAAYVDDLVTRDELVARVGQALGARTYAELAAVTAVIPARPAQVAPRRPRRVTDLSADGVAACDRAIMATAALAVLALVAAILSGAPAAGLLMLVAVGSAIGTLTLIGSGCATPAITGSGGPRSR